MKKNIKKLLSSVLGILLVISVFIPVYPHSTTSSLPEQKLIQGSVSLINVQYGIVGYQESVTKPQAVQNKAVSVKTTNISSKIENFKTEGGISNQNKNEIITDINSLPDAVINRFNKEGWTIYFTGYSISDKYYDGPVKGSIAGLTDYNNKIIYISEKDSYPTYKHILYHEVGHFVDWCNDRTSSTEDFYDIYQNESKNITVKGKSQRQINHAKSSPEEYYAEAFSKLLLGESMDKLKDTERVLQQDIHNL